MDKREREAEDFMKEGKKYASKTLTRWKPDWDTAATNYERAAQLYRSLKKLDKAQRAFELTADAHYKAGNTYLGGSNLESAAAIAKDLRNTAESISLYEKAAVMYQEDNKADRAAEVLTRAAKLCDDVEKAVDLFNRAVDVYETDERFHMAGDTYRSFTAYLVKHNKLLECIDVLRRQVKAYEHLNQPHNKFKCFLSIVLIHIYLNDWVAADNAYNDFSQSDGGFVSSTESSLAQELLFAIDSRDEDALKACIAKQGWNFLDNEIAKLSKKVKLFGTGGGNAAKARSQNTANSSARDALFAKSKPDSDDEAEAEEETYENQEEPTTSATASTSTPAPVTQPGTEDFDPNFLC